ncbi:MAG TPA: LysM peptidoglycan-binding domain-containing protein [Candidatus Aenigmarchaeota archaeon]|nr:LysM peptidoglycan-binding domain-containing protein [Candidatus Aenigmarchaeota archaeon]
MEKASLFHPIILLFLTSCAPHRVQETSLLYPVRKEKYYLVKKGDTLWKISKETGVSIEKIMEENDMTTTEIKAGQFISIPSIDRPKKILSFRWPLEGRVINFFGENINNVINQGINIMSGSNQEVKAAEDGYVIFCDYLKGWGLTIILKHPHNFYTVYANLREIFFKKSSFVEKGEVIAKASSTKNGYYILHFEIRDKYLPQDPLKYLK